MYRGNNWASHSTVTNFRHFGNLWLPLSEILPSPIIYQYLPILLILPSFPTQKMTRLRESTTLPNGTLQFANEPLSTALHCYM